MQLALHIFQKDLRRLWLHLLPCFVLTALLEMLPVASAASLGHVAGLLEPTLILSWANLIAMLVYQEPLIGERGYWLARPIPRFSLIGAKALFLLVAIHVPVLLMDCVVLWQNGFPAHGYVAGLLWKQVVLTGWIVLPLVALAAVTAGLGQFVTCIAAAVALVSAYLSRPAGLHPQWELMWVSDTVALAWMLPGFAAVILLQYRFRRSLQSRMLGAVAVLVIMLIYVLIPFTTAFAIQERVSPQGALPPTQMEFDRQRHPEPVPNLRAWTSEGLHKIDLAFKMQWEQDQPLPMNQIAHVTLPDGRNWALGSPAAFYEGYSNTREKHPTVSLYLRDDSMYAQYADRPVDVQITLYQTRVRLAAAGSFDALNGHARIPGMGVCRTDVLQMMQYVVVGCANPLTEPTGYELWVTDRDGRQLARWQKWSRRYSPWPSDSLVRTMRERGLGGFQVSMPGRDPVTPPMVSLAALEGAKVRIQTHEVVAHYRSKATVRGVRLKDYEVVGQASRPASRPVVMRSR